MTKLLVIYDTEVSYASRLMDYMKRSALTGFEVLLFTRRDSLDEFLKDHVVELLLLGEEVQEEIPRDNIRFILQLTGTKPISRKEITQNVYKYQPAREVINDLLSCYMKAQGIHGTDRYGELNIISVFAPAGGRREVTYATNLALCLAERQKVLYLPMEQLPVSSVSATAGEDQALSEFIYYLKEYDNSLISKLKELLKFSGKLACLSGIAHGLDLLSLDKEDAGKLIEELKKNTDYEAVIFYHGIYTEFTIELMKLSSSNYILSDGSLYSKGVLREWDRQMENLKMDTEAENFKRILIPESSYTEGAVDDILKENKNSTIWQLAKQQADLL